MPLKMPPSGLAVTPVILQQSWIRKDGCAWWIVRGPWGGKGRPGRVGGMLGGKGCPGGLSRATNDPTGAIEVTILQSAVSFYALTRFTLFPDAFYVSFPNGAKEMWFSFQVKLNAYKYCLIVLGVILKQTKVRRQLPWPFLGLRRGSFSTARGERRRRARFRVSRFADEARVVPRHDKRLHLAFRLRPRSRRLFSFIHREKMGSLETVGILHRAGSLTTAATDFSAAVYGVRTDKWFFWSWRMLYFAHPVPISFFLFLFHLAPHKSRYQSPEVLKFIYLEQLCSP